MRSEILGLLLRMKESVDVDKFAEEGVLFSFMRFCNRGSFSNRGNEEERGVEKSPHKHTARTDGSMSKITHLQYLCARVEYATQHEDQRLTRQFRKGRRIQISNDCLPSQF